MDPRLPRYLAADAAGNLVAIEGATKEAAEKTAGERGLHLASREEAAGLKCGDYAISYYPYAGAQSFADYDKYQAAAEKTGEINEQAWVFQNLVGNVMGDETISLAEKAARVASIADELSARVGEVERDPEEFSEDGTAERRNIFTKLATKVGDALRVPAAAATKPAVKAAVDAVVPLTRFDTKGSVFSAFKQADGSWGWAAVWSNAFEDRDGEAFSLKAHQDYVEWVDEKKSERMPELWYFHAPPAFGSKGEPKGMGRAQALDVTADGMAFAVGTFEPWAVEAGIPEKLKEAAEAGELGVSHGYHYPLEKFEGGVYKQFRTYEISPLPRWAEANDLTTFMVAEGEKGQTMSFNAGKRKDIEAILGPERTAQAESFLTQLGATAKQHGLSMKEVAGGLIDALDPGDPSPASVPAATDPNPSFGALIAQMQPMLLTAIKEGIEGATKPLSEAVTALQTELGQVKAAQKQLSDALPSGPRPFYMATKEGATVDENDPAVVAAKAAAEADTSGRLATKEVGLRDGFYMAPAVVPAAV